MKPLPSDTKVVDMTHTVPKQKPEVVIKITENSEIKYIQGVVFSEYPQKINHLLTPITTSTTDDAYDFLTRDLAEDALNQMKPNFPDTMAFEIVELEG